jgi:hypothetical protein
MKTFPIVKFLFISFITILFFSSCEDDVDLKDLGIKPKMVLNCHISPNFDSTIVFLSNSQPLLSSNSKQLTVISNALVEISNDNINWKKLTYNPDKKRYIISQTAFPIKEGKSYYIRATCADYDESISSSCTVPYYRNVDIKVDTQLMSYDEFYSSIQCNFSWKDFKGENNYYCITNYNANYYDSIVYINVDNVRTDSSWQYLYSDENLDGTIMKGSYFLYSTQEMKFNDTILFTLVEMDKNCYQYENTLQGNSLGDFLGFVEPTLIYNNIKNGYGMFGAIVFKNYYYILSDKTLHEF